MILDSEQQRGILLEALMNVPIQGTYQGIVETMPKFIALVEAVKTAVIENKKEGE
jgi:hypothetical protein